MKKIIRFRLAGSGAVQMYKHHCKKCNASAESLTLVQITHRNVG